MKKKNANNKGFSLVELIVVIAIMAVLVGVLGPQFMKYVEKGRQSTDIQTADNIATVLKTYYTDLTGLLLSSMLRLQALSSILQQTLELYTMLFLLLTRVSSSLNNYYFT